MKCKCLDASVHSRTMCTVRGFMISSMFNAYMCRLWMCSQKLHEASGEAGDATDTWSAEERDNEKNGPANAILNLFMLHFITVTSECDGQ